MWSFVNSFNVMVLFGYFCVNASLHSELCAVAFAQNYHKNAFMTLNEFTKLHTSAPLTCSGRGCSVEYPPSKKKCKFMHSI